MASTESKPDEAATNPEHINLKVMGQDGNIVQFKIKKHTALKKLMSTYCERAGLALQTIRFSFDGTRINESDTPKGLDMEDGDTIEVFQQQSGGTSFTITSRIDFKQPDYVKEAVLNRSLSSI